MKNKLDRYSLLIISKYFNTVEDYIRAMLTNKKFEDLVVMFHFNPIPINNSSKKLFINIQTQHVYNNYEDIIPNLFNYIVWYSATIETVEYFENKYRIRPIFKQLYVDHSFVSSGKKKEGDLLFLFSKSNQVNNDIDTIDCSDFFGIKENSCNDLQINGIKLGKHINSIPSYCFNNCSLKSIDLSFVTRIKEETFIWRNKLTSITLSKYLEIMDINCFNGCSSLKTITMSDNSKKFGLDVSFRLYEIMKNNGITCTGNIWIKNREEELKITDDFRLINIEDMFKLEELKLDSVRIIPICFRRCDKFKNLKKIILSTNILSLRAKSFCGLKLLESINLENANYIKYGGVMNCSKLKEANIYNTKILGRNVFYNCSNLITVTYSTQLNYLPENCFNKCLKLKEVKGIDNVTRIGSNCFNKCDKLRFDELPKNLIRICNSNGSKFKIKSIDKDCSISYFEEGCFKGNTTLESIHITKKSSTKKVIKKKAFSCCVALKEVKLEGIKSIGNCCFKDCYSLSTIELPSSLRAIGRYCFENCWSLKEIQIPSSVSHIGKDAFINCKSLTKVDFENGKIKTSFNIFNHCPLIEINLINGNKMKGCFSYEHYLMLKSKGIDVNKVEYTRSDRRKYGNIIPECCCRIGDRTFEGCSMKELTIPSKIKTLGVNCFNKCHNLIKIYMDSKLKNTISFEFNTTRDNKNDQISVEVEMLFNINGYETIVIKRKQKDDTAPIEIIKF